MKKALAILLTLCLLLGLTACGNEPTKAENTPTEEKTTTTTAPVEDKLDYADIVGGVRRVMAKDLPVFGSVTDEQQHTLEDGSITKSFKYADDLISVTITLKNGDIQSVIALCNTAKMPADENINTIQLSIVFMCVVGSVIYNDGDVFAMGDDIIANDPTDMTDVGMTYMLKDEKWEYVMQLTTLISTLYIAPIKTEDTATTTTADSTTTSQAIHQQPTVSKQQEATKQPTSTQEKPTSTQSKPITTQNKPTSTTTTQNKPTTTQNKPTSTTTTQSKSTTTQNKPTSTTTTQSQDPCAHGHDWEALYETVQYEEKGHYETVITGYNTITSYKCAMCYEVFPSLDAYYTHFAQHEASSDSSASLFKERYETVTQQEPIYSEEWVIDQEEETVQELIGYQCRVCGKKKN